MARWRENREADQGWRGASREVSLPAATTAARSGDPDRRCGKATEARMASTREQGIGSVPVQEAPGGNPGTPGTKTSPPSMSCNATRFHAANPNRMAPGNACHPESPGFRRGLFGCLSRACSKKPRVETRGLRARKPLPAVHAAWHDGRRPPLQGASVAAARQLMRGASVRPTTCTRRRSRARGA